jgi:hypothetical protein
MYQKGRLEFELAFTEKWGRRPIYLFLRLTNFPILKHGAAAKIGK